MKRRHWTQTPAGRKIVAANAAKRHGQGNELKRHKATFRLEVTAFGHMTHDEFVAGVATKLFLAEMALNRDGVFRFHILEAQP